MLTDNFHTCDLVLMVRPALFAFNREAAASNAFAHSPDGDVAGQALAEFDRAVAILREGGVSVVVMDEAGDDQPAPDAVFPNNWISLHGDGAAILYPMAHESRRRERAPDALFDLLEDQGRAIDCVIDLTALEDSGEYLEGTGSLIFDRMGGKAYACRSERTTDLAVSVFEEASGWPVHLFEAADASGKPIYHTNVLLSLGARFAVLCTQAVAADDRDELISTLEESRREIIDVSFEQMTQFACNILEVRDRYGAVVLLMSEAARSAFTPDQIALLERLSGRIVSVPIPTIERVGGGSLRCMIAEVALPEA